VGPAGDTFAAPTREFRSSPVSPPAFDVRKPVIAAVNGHAIGIGLSLAMQCDLRVFAEGAKYGFVHVRRGVIPDAHSHWTVPRAIGFARAADLLLTGRHVGADEAVVGAEVLAQAEVDIACGIEGKARQAVVRIIAFSDEFDEIGSLVATTIAVAITQAEDVVAGGDEY